MRKFLVLLVVLCGLVIPTVAIAATLDTSKFTDLIADGVGCEDGDDGAWYHFVVNQIAGDYQAGVKVTATFSDASENQTVTATAINKSTQHFYVFGESTLTGANTNAGTNVGTRANIVLSHIVCGKLSDGVPHG